MAISQSPIEVFGCPRCKRPFQTRRIRPDETDAQVLARIGFKASSKGSLGSSSGEALVCAHCAAYPALCVDVHNFVPASAGDLPYLRNPGAYYRCRHCGLVARTCSISLPGPQPRSVAVA